MKVLAIETSCDETGIAIVEGKVQGDALKSPCVKAPPLVFKTLKAALLSQAHLHAPYGGVYPNLAKREHEKNLPVLFEQILKEAPSQAKESPLGVDAIAVTQGPGLEPALWQGITFAQKLAAEKKLPLFGVNHMEAHLISSLAQTQGQTLTQGPQGLTFGLKNIKLPVLALLVSGGHTEFVLMREWFAYEVIGETLDDAVGECFDKVARMLELPYPGGPEISKLAERARVEASPRHAWRLPRPMLNSGTCDVSFSGLKTAALYALRDLQRPRSDLKAGLPKVRPLTLEEKAAFAAEFEEAVGDVFVAKTRKALQETGAQTFVIGGGVAANRYLRERLQALVLEEFSYSAEASRDKPDVEFRLPELSITGDNAIMVAQCALAHLLSDDWKLSRSRLDMKAIGNLSISQGDTFQN